MFKDHGGTMSKRTRKCSQKLLPLRREILRFLVLQWKVHIPMCICRFNHRWRLQPNFYLFNVWYIIIHFGSPSVVSFASHTFGCILIVFWFYVMFVIWIQMHWQVCSFQRLLLLLNLFMDVYYRFPSNLFVNPTFSYNLVRTWSPWSVSITWKNPPITKQSIKYAQ